MPKISKYPLQKVLEGGDYTIYENVYGKTIKMPSEEHLYALTDALAIKKPSTASSIKNLFYRGKNLGSKVLTSQWKYIKDGTFYGLQLGDYWTINDVRWQIVDFDYWYGTGDTPCITHHVVIMPDAPIIYDPSWAILMNDTNTTAGGFMGSKMYTTNIQPIKEKIFNCFTSDHVLSYRDLLSNSVQNNLVTSLAWTSVDVTIPNEYMIAGYSIKHGNVLITNGTSNKHLAAFKVNPKVYRFGSGYDYWLRDVWDSSQFESIIWNGTLGYNNANNNWTSVRPVFGLIG